MKSRFRKFGIPLLICLLSLSVRVKPFIHADHFFQVPVDFDEGVYFGAAALLSQGILPYRDFDFAHPPGIVWMFSIWHQLLPFASLAQRFMLAKSAMAGLGALTTLGIFLLGKKWGGLGVGVLASLLYATYPEAISAERSIFLEPLINAIAVSCLLLLSSEKKVSLLIGLLLSLAVSIKFTAVIWIPPFALLAWQSGRLRSLGSLVAGGLLGFLLFLLPWILVDPQHFLQGVIQFQLTRPPDGDISLSSRLHSILRDQHLAMNVFAFLGLCSLPWVPRLRRGMWFATASAFMLAVSVLLLSKGFWGQYNTLLALPQALVASFIGLPQGNWRVRRVLAVFIGMFLLIGPIRSAFKSGRARAPQQITLIEELNQIPDSACIFSFEPAWLIMANRFPANCQSPIILDSYLVMLMDGSQGRTFADPAAVFANEESQLRIRQSIQHSEILVLGPRGEAQANEKTKAMIHHSFRAEGLLFQALPDH